MGPFGADRLRAEARRLVRDNSYAWGVVDTIVSSVVGAGIQAQSTYETPEGDDIEDINDLRDKAWSEWSEVADIKGRLTLEEIQIIALREMVEAGEVLIRIVNLPSTEYRGISRPIPMALEIIEADRLATDRDTYTMGIDRGDGTRVIRGIKVDESGKPLAYMIYDDHPLQPHAVSRTPKEIPAREIIHLFRQDRVGQTRGVTWFAPALASIRDLGTYLDNELQASAIASCFTAAIKTETPLGRLSDPDAGDGIDRRGNQERYLEPGLVFELNPNESVEVINPTRPNTSAGEWTKVILRGIAVGTGLSYEVVARDYSQTTYSSSRTSQLEDRRRFRIIQKYIIRHLLQPVWDRFCDAASRTNLDGFPGPSDLLSDRRRFTPVEWQTPKWEWVDPGVEQVTSEAGINSFTATYSEVLGAQGLNFRTVFYQRAKENRLLAKLGLQTPEQTQLAISAAQTQGASDNTSDVAAGDQSQVDVAATALNGAQVTSLVDVITQVGTGAMPKDTAKAIIQAAFPTMGLELTNSIIDPIQPGSISADGVPSAASETQPATGSGEMMGLSTQQWNRNRKAIAKTLDELASGVISEAAARVFLSSVGMSEASVQALIDDAKDGSVDTLPAEVTA
jgi:lambda family phage portal protein